jgi:hypothetical protein
LVMPAHQAQLGEGGTLIRYQAWREEHSRS